MTDALEKALTDAVKTGTDKAYIALNKANVAGKLFDLLQPSTLPGGASKSSGVTSATADITRQEARQLRLRHCEATCPIKLSGVASERLALRDAREAVTGLTLDIAGSFSGLRDQYTDARGAQAAIDSYNKSLGTLHTQLSNGTLASLAANLGTLRRLQANSSPTRTR